MAVVAEIEAGPAISLRHGGAQQARRPAGPPKFTIDQMGTLPSVHVRDKITIDETANLITEQCVLIRISGAGAGIDHV